MGIGYRVVPVGNIPQNEDFYRETYAQEIIRGFFEPYRQQDSEIDWEFSESEDRILVKSSDEQVRETTRYVYHTASELEEAATDLYFWALNK